MRVLAPLRQKSVALLWGGLAISAIGDQLYLVAVVWIATRLLGPAAGYVNAAQVAAAFTAALFVGIWADRWPQRATMIAADLLRAAALFALVAYGLAVDLGIVPLLLVAMLVASLQSVFRPALRATVPTLVTDVFHLPAISGLFDATTRSARLVGPLIAGLLSAVLPPIHLLTLDALSFCASALAIGLLGRLSAPQRVPAPAPRGPMSLWRSAVKGFYVARRDAIMFYVVVTTGAITGFWYVNLFLGLPLLIQQRQVSLFGATQAGAYAYIVALYGATNIVTNLVLGGRLPKNPAALIVAGNMVMGLGFSIIGLAGAANSDLVLLASLAFGAAIAGIGGPMEQVTANTLQYVRFAPDEIAAIDRAVLVGNNGGMLVSMLIAPTLIVAFGPAALCAVAGLGIVAIGVAGALLFARRVAAEAA